MSASNSVHYMHDTTRPWAGPLAAYTGHIQGSFYIKTAFAPDGQHFASGSSNGSACIWAVSNCNACLVIVSRCFNLLVTKLFQRDRTRP